MPNENGTFCLVREWWLLVLFSKLQQKCQHTQIYSFKRKVKNHKDTFQGQHLHLTLNQSSLLLRGAMWLLVAPSAPNSTTRIVLLWETQPMVCASARGDSTDCSQQTPVKVLILCVFLFHVFPHFGSSPALDTALGKCVWIEQFPIENFAGPFGALITFNLTWIARKYELEELHFHDNLSDPTSELYTDLSTRLVYSGVSFFLLWLQRHFLRNAWQNQPKKTDIFSGRWRVPCVRDLAWLPGRSIAQLPRQQLHQHHTRGRSGRPRDDISPSQSLLLTWAASDHSSQFNKHVSAKDAISVFSSLFTRACFHALFCHCSLFFS